MKRAVVSALLLVACRPAVDATAPRGHNGLGDTLAGASVRGHEGPVATEALIEAVVAADVICVGEQHDDAGHHRVQHALLQQLVRASERSLALGLEMVQRPWQSTLDDYSRGDLDEAGLAEALQWRARWGFDFSMYEPLFHTAHEHGVRLLALNAPKALTRAVARMGLEHLPPDVQESLPDLDLKDEGHRQFFWAAMGFGEPNGGSHHDPHASPHHGSPHGMAGATERFYTAQVIWDETMAEGAAAWLGDARRQVMVIAGNGHCHQSAIPSRVKRRKAGTTTLSVLLQSGDVPLPPHATSDFVIELPDDGEVRPDAEASAMATR